MATNEGGLDQNSRRTLSALSSVDGVSVVNLWADPVTHRLLVDLLVSFAEMTATGVVNGVNTQFTFTSEPAYIISDGVFYKKTDNNGVVQWSWNSILLQATMTIPPQSSIWGF